MSSLHSRSIGEPVSRSKIAKRLAISGVVAATMIGASAGMSNAASNDITIGNQSCGIASGWGYTCTTVEHSGAYINAVWAIRSNAAPPWICRASAWVYYVPPWGGAYGLAYQEDGGCQYGTFRFRLPVNRWVPSGSRVCSKFMEYGNPSGPEPCVKVW